MIVPESSSQVTGDRAQPHRYQPPVTAIIPTYNRQATLCEAVDSVLAQSYSACSVLIVDDGSTDDTPRQIQARYGNDPRVRYHLIPNGGVSAARNRGVELATTELIAFLDSDDRWHPQKLELQVACYQALGGRVGAIWTDMHDMAPDGSRCRSNTLRCSFGLYDLVPLEKMFQASATLQALSVASPARFQKARLHWGDIAAYLLLGNMCRPSALLLTRSRFYRAGAFNESLTLGEDHDFHIRLMATGQGACLDIPLIDYRTGGEDQLSRPDNEILFAESLLSTVVPLLHRSRGTLPIPARLIDRKCAFAHFWYARENLRRGREDVARRHFLAGLRYSPADWRGWAWLLLSGIPKGLRSRFRISRTVSASHSLNVAIPG